MIFEWILNVDDDTVAYSMWCLYVMRIDINENGAWFKRKGITRCFHFQFWFSVKRSMRFYLYIHMESGLSKSCNSQFTIHWERLSSRLLLWHFNQNLIEMRFKWLLKTILHICFCPFTRIFSFLYFYIKISSINFWENSWVWMFDVYANGLYKKNSGRKFKIEI